jgi:predicted  nucleic acid-binding Zn-ribbon protein
MIDLMCIDCGACFDEDDLDDCKCPECGSSHYDYYDDVMEDDDL